MVVSGEHASGRPGTRRAAPADPSLRLAVRLDDREVVAYTDVNLDPEDLPGAVVNSFVFSPERLFVSAGDGVTAPPPELAAGQIRLALELPPGAGRTRERLRLAYQVNDGTSSAPGLARRGRGRGQRRPRARGAGRASRVQQDRGTMEYTDTRMQNVETFRVVARSARGASP